MSEVASASFLFGVTTGEGSLAEESSTSDSTSLVEKSALGSTTIEGFERVPIALDSKVVKNWRAE